jgi:putative transposase
MPPPASPSRPNDDSADAHPGLPELCPAGVRALFLQLLPAEFWAQMRRQQPRQNNRVYTFAVVTWLMVVQRLQGPGTLYTAVLELLRDLPADFWPRPCKRLQPAAEPPSRPLSSHTGAYNQARQELPVGVMEQCCEQVFRRLTETIAGRLPEVDRRAFFLDGTSARLPHTAALCALYPPGSNQHGESHWPLIRMLVAHDLYSGVAMRPQWGPMHGAHAVSEQGLLELAIDRLPSGALAVGDANFGVFSVAYVADQRDHPVVLRLTHARAQHLAGEPLRDGIDRLIQWWPSREDRRSHPELPAEAYVRGRLIVRQVQPSDGSAAILLALFSTLEAPADESVRIYGRRWIIETDLRSLKVALALEQLTCTTPDMVAKEIEAAMLSYNLVRAIACLAAQEAGLPPRAFSFTGVRNVANAFAPLIAAAPDEPSRQQLLARMMYYAGQARLPQRRSKRRSYPRAVWGRPKAYPKRRI